MGGVLVELNEARSLHQRQLTCDAAHFWDSTIHNPATMASLPTAVRATAPKIVRSAIQQQRRAISDVHITRTGKPLIRTQGGRFVALLPF